MDTNATRKRKNTERFGDAVNFSSEESENSFLDDSFIDENYEPDAFGTKVIATVRTVSKRPRLSNENSTNSTSLTNYDHLFNEIEENTTLSDTVVNKINSHCDQVGMNKMKPDEITKIVQSLKADIDLLRQLVMISHRKSDEILARMAVMESQVIDNDIDRKIGSQKCDETEMERTQAFLKSINLPISTKSDLDKFEENLADNKFRSAVVRIF